MAVDNDPTDEPDYDCALDAVALADLVRELVSGDPGALTDGEMSDALVALNRLGAMVDTAAAVYAARWDSRMVWAGDAARSGGAWLAAHTEWSRHKAQRTIAMGRDLRECPHVEAAYRAGLIGAAKVELLLKVRVGLEEIFAEHESMIVDDIRDRTVRATGDRLRHWRRIASQTVKGDGDSAPEPPDTTDTASPETTPAPCTCGGETARSSPRCFAAANFLWTLYQVRRPATGCSQACPGSTGQEGHRRRALRRPSRHLRTHRRQGRRRRICPPGPNRRTPHPDRRRRPGSGCSPNVGRGPSGRPHATGG